MSYQNNPVLQQFEYYENHPLKHADIQGAVREETQDAPPTPFPPELSDVHSHLLAAMLQRISNNPLGDPFGFRVSKAPKVFQRNNVTVTTVSNNSLNTAIIQLRSGLDNVDDPDMTITIPAQQTLPSFELYFPNGFTVTGVTFANTVPNDVHKTIYIGGRST